MKLRCDYDRRLEASNSYESAELPSSDDFALDGTSSDLARQLYLRAKAGGQVEQLDSFTLPVAVQTRLDELKLEWGSLPGVAQRALLWDSGFVVSLSNQAVQIWPLSGHSMTNLAVPLVDFHAVGCEEKNCTQPDNTTSSSNHYCSGVKMVAAARCVVDDFDDSSNPNTAMWEIGGDPDAVPAPWITKHTWRDYSTGDSYKVPAIHTMDLNDEPSYNTCAASDQNGGYGSLVFPCYLTSNASDTIKSEKQQVNGSAWVSQWLVEDYAVSSHDAINVSLIIAIICGIIFIALVVLLVVIKRRRKKHASSTALAETDTCAGNNRQGSSPRDSGGDRSTVPTLEDNDIVPDRIVGKTSSIAPAYQELNSEWNFTLKTLLGSKFLVGKCIPYESVKFERAISKGAHGEVWLGEYQGQQVAVKRLLQTKTHQAYESQ
ncbi:TKL protein kinase [Phytophthora cinnamomi]|uniref:TKL protein kinase n=1 Tax=Phytophthora cinnamomi TaxID=4785 RepID=UPI00355AAC08|nr:TKL protein kinase [Phytophthora cinnamomi]